MEKISGIIASTPRITSADMRNSGVVRPGTPSFGRPQGVSTVANRAEIASGRATDELESLRSAREPNAQPKNEKAEIVERMAKNFFNNKPSVAATAVEGPRDEASQEILRKFQTEEESAFNPKGSAVLEHLDEDSPVIGGRVNLIA